MTSHHILTVIGDVDVCRNLARIASVVCDTWVDVMFNANPMKTNTTEFGAVTFLLKGSNHPSINICAICLQPLARLIPLVPSLSADLLPVLQRRAIIPHHLKLGQIDFDGAEFCGVAVHEFLTFRQTILSEALIACWKEHDKHFMDSCTSAIEEFCSAPTSCEVSMQSEAALFCIGQISWEDVCESENRFIIDKILHRLLKALMKKSPNVISNPLTRESLCRFIRKVNRKEATVLHMLILFLSTF
jgi:hypothetical protein